MSKGFGCETPESTPERALTVEQVDDWRRESSLWLTHTKHDNPLAPLNVDQRIVRLCDSHERLRAQLLAVTAERDEARQEIARLSEWQPMETAPKDGREVLTYQRNADRIRVAHCEGGEWWWCSDEYTCTPTHWMPLPAPPKEAI